MKTIKLSLSVLVFMFLLVSCYEEEPTIEDQPQEISLSDAGVEIAQVDNDADIAIVLQSLRSEAISRIESEEAIENIEMKVNIRNGKVFYEGYLAAGKDLKVVEAKLSEVAIDEYSDKNGRFPIELFIAPSCPEGTSFIGSCSNFSGNSSDCVGAFINDYLTENVSGVGDCSTVSVKVGTFNTSVCGASC